MARLDEVKLVDERKCLMQQKLPVLVDYIRTSVEILLNMRLEKSQARHLMKHLGSS